MLISRLFRYLNLRRTSADYSNFGVVDWFWQEDRLTGALVEERELIYSLSYFTIKMASISHNINISFDGLLLDRLVKIADLKSFWPRSIFEEKIDTFKNSR